jgi:hypothetical protein
MPASRNYELDKGFAATGAVTKFRAVKLSNAGPQTVAPFAAGADLPLGVAQESLSALEQSRNFGIPVALIGAGGETEMEAGATGVNIGDAIVCDAAGRGVPVGTGSAGTIVIGLARQAAASGLRFTMTIGNY